jgi:hypothetical protein
MRVTTGMKRGGEKKEGDYSCYTVVVVVQHHIEEVGAVPVP